MSYFLFNYINEHGGILYVRRFMKEYNVKEKKYRMALKVLIDLGLVSKGKGRTVKIRTDDC